MATNALIMQTQLWEQTKFVAQAINYLKISKNQLALLVNFGEFKINYKRIVL